MKVFKVFGKFEQYNRWSDLEADFVGYFVKEDGSDVLIGYMEEQYDSPYDPIRYITGMYLEENNQLVFLKMSNEEELSPLMYVFPDLNKKGVWSHYEMFFEERFFSCGQADGYAKIKIEEITEDTTERSNEIKAIYSKVLEVGLKINTNLIAKIDEYKEFLDMVIEE